MRLGVKGFFVYNIVYDNIYYNIILHISIGRRTTFQYFYNPIYYVCKLYSPYIHVLYIYIIIILYIMCYTGLRTIDRESLNISALPSYPQWNILCAHLSPHDISDEKFLIEIVSTSRYAVIRFTTTYVGIVQDADGVIYFYFLRAYTTFPHCIYNML